MRIQKRKRTPKAIVQLARKLWDMGKPMIAIEFETGLTAEHIKRLCDPETARWERYKHINRARAASKG